MQLAPAGLVLAFTAALALFSCAHGGGEVYLSPTASFPRDAAPAVANTAAPAQPAIPRDASMITGDALIVPDPAQLGIRAAPTVHHAVDLVSRQSAVIVASYGGAPVVIHNNGDLLGRDGCAEVRLAPEGDTRLTMILPEPGTEMRNRFYLVGCSAGEATLDIHSEGELLNRYTFTVSSP